MEKASCQSCFTAQTFLTCNLCEEHVCKSCARFVDEDEFEYPTLLPENIQNKTLCVSCFSKEADPVIEEYKTVLEKAKVVDVYDIKQGSETGLIKRIEKPLRIQDCDDREETLLRLAFLAAQKGYSTIVDVNLKSKKVEQGGKYKKLMWSGSGVPVDPKIRK